MTAAALRIEAVGRLYGNARRIPTRTGSPMAAATVEVELATRTGSALHHFHAVAFGAPAEKLLALGNGAAVAVSGTFELETWRGRNGQGRRRLRIRAATVEEIGTERRDRREPAP